VFSAVVSVFLLALLANHPGYYHDTDIAVQWYQAHSGTFDDWHPAIYTMLIWLVTRIHNSYGFFIAVQILFFSLLCGYMASTLRAWGFQKIWIAVFTITIISAQSTRTLMLYAYKDGIFSCLVLWSAIYLANIVLSDGAWLTKWGNRIALALVLGFASIIRHNGFVFTVPVIALLCAFYARKQTLACVFTGALALATVAGVKGPLYKAVGVTHSAEHQTYIETSFMPVSLLGSVYLVNPGALDEDAINLMEHLATPEEWEKYGRFGDIRATKGVAMLRPRRLSLQSNISPRYFNEAVKEFQDDYVPLCPPEKLLSMTLHVLRNDPEIVCMAYAAATCVVWDPTAFQFSAEPFVGINDGVNVLAIRNDDAVFNDFLDCFGTSPSIRSEALMASQSPFFQKFQNFYSVLDTVISTLTPSRMLQCVGLNMLLLMLCMWLSLCSRRGWPSLLLALPGIAYNLVHMFFLGGPEYRLFQFNAVITVPLILVCLAKTEKKVKNE